MSPPHREYSIIKYTRKARVRDQGKDADALS